LDLLVSPLALMALTTPVQQPTLAWQWKANGAGSSNTDGSITSTVSADTTSGFSIIRWSGTGANGTIGHGLGIQPSLYIVKNTATTNSWLVGSTLLL
jgi:hypothetical protein